MQILIRSRSTVRQARRSNESPAQGMHLLAAFAVALAPILTLAVVGFARAGRLGSLVFVMLAAATLLSLAIAHVAVRRLLTDPLGMFTRSILSIEHGDLPTRSGVPHDTGEFGRLAAAFDRMVDVLRERSEEAARAHRALQWRADRLEGLHRIDMATQASASVAPIARTALTEVKRFASCDEAVVEEWDEATGNMRVIGANPDGRSGTSPVSSTTALGGIESLRGGKPIVVHDVERLPHSSPSARAVRSKEVRSYMVIPLRCSDEVIGALTLAATQSHAFSPDDIAVAQEVADHLAAAMARTRIRDDAAVKSEELARTVQTLRSADDERKELLTRLVRAQEEERRRIASDVHDDPLQVMTAANLRLQMLRRMIVDPEPAQMLTQLEHNVHQAIVRLRNLLFQLRPPTLDRQGLAPAIRLCLEQLTSELTVEHNLENRLGEEPSLEIRIVIYRIAQEAITNVRKHAMAEHISVLLAYEADGYLVRVRDDGRGFDPSAAEHARPGHQGIFAMRERTEIAGGRISIDSAPGAGTTVEFWLPGEPARPAVAS
ncbi:MAG: GAF domain-containing protein [Actinomycetota bacterium]